MTESELTDVVLQRYGNTPQPRLREILQALIRHAHAFVRETRLTEEEWMAGIRFLTAAGQMCDDRRQEMILLSDNLGISALVNMVQTCVSERATESTVLGPFYVPNTPQRKWGESLLLRRSEEMPLLIRGQVLDEEGGAIANATLEVWQTDSNGMYDIQDAGQPKDNLRGCYTANERGEFLIRTIRPTSYPIPTDGPVGDLLRATSRQPYRPAHVHVMVGAPGFHRLTTHLFDSEDPYLDCDVVFAVKGSLVRKFVRNERATDAAEAGLQGPFWELHNDFVLAKAR